MKKIGLLEITILTSIQIKIKLIPESYLKADKMHKIKL